MKEYYNTDWLTDVRDDSYGLLPKGLKKGVLSEDAIFNLLASDVAVFESVSELFSEKGGR